MTPALQPVTDYLREHSPVFYLALDAAGVVRETNRFTTTLLGRDVTGRPFREVFVNFAGTLDPATLAREPARLQPLDVSTAAGLPQTIQCGFHAAGGLILALGHLDVAEIQSLQGQFLELNNELNVVTRDLQKANAQLKKLNELKNRFVGFAAHDLRKPVGVIQTYTEFLRDEARDRLTAEQAEFLDIIHERARTMAELIDELLDIAMIESGRNEAKLALTGLAQIFQIASLSVKRIADAKQVQIEVALDPALPDLQLDRLKIEQVVVNLLGNAVEHTRPGTTVRLDARRDGDQVVVTVRDQGTGIPAALLDKLFQPFARGQTEKAGGHASHGLGLAIAKRMVEAHRGRIWAENNPDGGATFSFTLPVVRPAHPPLQSPTTPVDETPA